MPDIFTSPKKTFHAPLLTGMTEMKSQGSPHIGLRQALSAFVYMPQRIRFETQSDTEIIILLLRKHWITNLDWVLLSLIFFVIPFFLFPYLLFIGLFPNVLPYQYLTLFVFVWYLISITYTFSNFLLWYFTVSIVTNERVVDIDFINLLNKKFAETRIARVEDVTMHTGGFVKAFFDYGDVLVQTAAKEQEFQFYAIPKPDKVVRIINGLMGREEEETHKH